MLPISPSLCHILPHYLNITKLAEGDQAPPPLTLTFGRHQGFAHWRAPAHGTDVGHAEVTPEVLSRVPFEALIPQQGFEACGHEAEEAYILKESTPTTVASRLKTPREWKIKVCVRACVCVIWQERAEFINRSSMLTRSDFCKRKALYIIYMSFILYFWASIPL